MLLGGFSRAYRLEGLLGGHSGVLGFLGELGFWAFFSLLFDFIVVCVFLEDPVNCPNVDSVIQYQSFPLHGDNSSRLPRAFSRILDPSPPSVC